MAEDLTPILVGGGQLTRREADPATAPDPIAMMAAAARLAAADAGLTEAALARLDRLALVRSFSGRFADPARRLGEALGAAAARGTVSAVGGDAPQHLVNGIMGDIAEGSCRLALVVGAEALATAARAARAGIDLPWGGFTLTAADQNGTSAQEAAHGLVPPAHTYPLFENALRAKRGRSQTAHRRKIGDLFAPFTAVAAANPLAWFPVARSAAELITPGPGNRLVGYPYTKRVNAMLAVDQAAALLVTSVVEARRLGIPEARWVYLRGHAAAHDHWHVTERIEYHASPAIRAVGQAALAMAGRTIADIALVDLYSCFPSAVQIAKDALALPEVDGPPLTVTGGLPYFGGPGNNYASHAIAEMMTRLRAAPGRLGLVTATGWYLTKHAVGIYSTERPALPFRRADDHALQAALDAQPKPDVAMAPEGRARIETYSVIHGRDGAPKLGIVIGRLVDDKRRFVANTPDDPGLLDALLDGEAIGRRGRVAGADGRNLFTPD